MKGGMPMFCEECGTELKDGVKFCPECGTKVKSQNGNSNQNEASVNGQNIQNGQPKPVNRTQQFISGNQKMPYGSPYWGAKPGNVNPQKFGPQGNTNHQNYGPNVNVNPQSCAPQGSYGQRPPYANPPAPQKKKGHGGLILLLILIAAAAVFVITAFFKPGFLREKLGLPGNNAVSIENRRQIGKTVSLSNGLLSLNDMIVDFSATGVADGKATLSEEKAASFEKENGLISELYSITYDEGTSGLVTVTLPLPKDFDESQGGTIRLGIGRDYTREDGVVVTPFEYLEAVIDNGLMTAVFDPSMFPETAFFGRTGDEDTGFAMMSLENADKKNYGQVKRYFGYFWTDGFFFENGHFKVWHPTSLKVDQSDRESLLNDLESIYSFYADKGYMMGSKYPMDVNIAMKIEGMDGYSQGSSITLSAPLLFGNEKKQEPVYPAHQTASRMLLKHEFFHTIQVNYLGWMAGRSWSAAWQESVWFDEATAVYYEANEAGDAKCAQSDKYVERIWEGLMPDDKMSADAGYARGPLVAFVTEKLGSDEWIKTVYSAYYEDGIPLNDSIRYYFESIPNAAEEFFLGYITGKYCSVYGDHGPEHTPGRFFFAVDKNFPDVDAASSYLSIAEPDNRKALDEAIKKREPFTLDEKAITLNGTGAFLFDLHIIPMDDIPDDYQVALYCDGCKVSVFEVVRSLNAGTDRKLEGSVISLKEIREAFDNDRDFLSLVVSNAPIGEKADTVFKAVLEPSDSSITGTWSIEGEGSYSSGLLDPLMGLLEKYAGEYDAGNILGLSGYGDLYRESQNSSFSGGRMTIQNSGEKNIYDVNIKFNAQSPVQAYRGTYDPSSKELKLKQKNSTYTDPDGNTFDLEQLGMTAELTFTFSIEKDPETGKVKQAFTGTGGQSSSIISTSGTYRGEKLSDKIEAIE